MRYIPHPMAMMEGSVVVSFGIDPERASPSQKARLVEAGMSLRLVDDNGLQSGPVFPVPPQWLRECEDKLYFRGRMTFRNWTGPIGAYALAWLRATPTEQTCRYVPRPIELLLPFRRTAFAPTIYSTVHFNDFKVH